jgi:phage baseplate assembly protein W
MADYKTLYIKYPGHPAYNSKKVVEDEPIGVIVNKIEMILFTNKGEVYGQPLLGADLYNYLHQTNVSADFVKSEIEDQIRRFVPEITNLMYKLEVTILAGTVRDLMLIDFTLEGVKINAVFA